MIWWEGKVSDVDAMFVSDLQKNPHSANEGSSVRLYLSLWSRILMEKTNKKETKVARVILVKWCIFWLINMTLHGSCKL